MAANLVKAGHHVTGFDLSAAAIEDARTAGCSIADSAVETATDKDVVVTMLPAGKHVVAVYDEIKNSVRAGSLMIDSSTIDISSAQQAHAIADSVVH